MIASVSELFAAQSVVEWSRTVVVEEIPTHQCITSHWQDMGALGLMATEDEYGQSELDVFKNSQPMQISKQMGDVLMLWRVIYKTLRSIQDGLMAVYRASRYARQGHTAVIQPQHSQHSDQRQRLMVWHSDY